MRSFILTLTVLGLVALFALFGCAGTANGNGGEVTEEAAEETVEEALEAETGEAVEETLDVAVLINDRCTICHTADRIESEKGDADDWEEIVDEMIGKGAKLNDEERAALIAYLSAE